MPTKKCFKCGIKKELSFFYKHSKMTDGHVGKCKKCNKADVSRNYRKNRKHYQEYEKKRNNNPERKAKISLYKKSVKINTPGRYKAHIKVSNAIRDGKLIRKPCEICGDEKTNAHHDDYRKWKDVRWLCNKHHREIHGQMFNPLIN